MNTLFLALNACLFERLFVNDATDLNGIEESRRLLNHEEVVFRDQ